MTTIVDVSDLIDPGDAGGRSYREVNATKTHAIPIGSLVELKDGVRLFVVYHARDCDQTPLYSLSDDPSNTEQNRQRFYNRAWRNGFSEDSLAVVRYPSEGG